MKIGYSLTTSIPESLNHAITVSWLVPSYHLMPKRKEKHLDVEGIERSQRILSENTTQHQIGATKKSPNVKSPNEKKSETKIGAQSGPDSPP